MISTLVIEEPKEDVKVLIPQGAGIQQIGQIYYDPEVIQIATGTSVVWENLDSAAHTVTSGNPQDGSNGLFDSGMISPNGSFKHTFSSEGKEDYYCMLHPWMIGTVNIE
jgi:plastocyanin